MEIRRTLERFAWRRPRASLLVFLAALAPGLSCSDDLPEKVNLRRMAGQEPRPHIVASSPASRQGGHVLLRGPAPERHAE